MFVFVHLLSLCVSFCLSSCDPVSLELSVGLSYFWSVCHSTCTCQFALLLVGPSAGLSPI